MTGRPLKIFTIGYQDYSIDQFIAKIQDNDINTIIDIRDNPYSRNKAFSKKSLAESLNNKGIEYYHFKELGSPRKLRQKVREDRDYPYFFREYKKHLLIQSNTLLNLYNLLHSNIICLLCYEHDCDICHRKIVAQELGRYDNIKIINM